MIRCKIDEWTISLNQNTCKVQVKQEGKTGCKEYSTKIFKRDGMLSLPKPLYNLICKDIKYANIYDKFLHKFYDWDESE